MAFVGPVAERRIGRMPTAAKGNGGAAAEAKYLALLIDNLKVPFHAKRSVAENGYFGTRHEFLR